MKTTTTYRKSIKSPFDFTVLKKGSSNKKLGFKVTSKKWLGSRLFSLTLTERATCPTSCHHWEDCYGNNMPFAHRFDVVGLEDKLRIEVAELCKKYPNGVVIRLHVLGDFYSVEYLKFWEEMLSQHNNLRVFGYTAREIDSPIGAAIHRINVLQPDRFVVRYSRNMETKRSGLWYAAEESFDGKHFDCPEQSGKLESCAACGLCWTVQNTVRFATH